jgi:hypothetical protein
MLGTEFCLCFQGLDKSFHFSEPQCLLKQEDVGLVSVHKSELEGEAGIQSCADEMVGRETGSRGSLASLTHLGLYHPGQSILPPIRSL